MKDDYTKIELISKIVESRLKATEALKEVRCTCMVDMDPDYYGPCTCKNKDARQALEKILEALKL